MIGFITLHRKITEWQWYQDGNTMRLFIHLLLKANHKKGFWQGIEIQRGQHITGRKVLANALGLTEQQIRTSLKKLEKSGNITSKTTNKNSIIEIINYNDYQQDNQQITNEQPTDNQQITTNNNNNTNNNEKTNNNLLSNDNTTEVVDNRKEDINNMQEVIKQTIQNNGMIYKAGKQERNRIQNLLTGKDFGEICEKVEMTREVFIINIINLATKLKYGKPINNGVDLFYNYASVYNLAVKMKAEFLEPKILRTIG